MLLSRWPPTRTEGDMTDTNIELIREALRVAIRCLDYYRWIPAYKLCRDALRRLGGLEDEQKELRHTPYHTSRENMGKYIEKLRKFRPKFIKGLRGEPR